MHVFITGASSGIGEALAHEFHKRGGSVSLVARRKAKLDTLVGELGNRALAIEADLVDPRAAEAAVAPAEAAFGPIDVLVNNAGVQIARARSSSVARAWCIRVRMPCRSSSRSSLAGFP